MRSTSKFAGMAGALAAVGMLQAAVAAPVQRGPRIPVATRLPESRLNRSKKWDYARTYKEARAISPIPHIPVR